MTMGSVIAGREVHLRASWTERRASGWCEGRRAGLLCSMEWAW
jgi:hypothetical protein